MRRPDGHAGAVRLAPAAVDSLRRYRPQRSTRRRAARDKPRSCHTPINAFVLLEPGPGSELPRQPLVGAPRQRAAGEGVRSRALARAVRTHLSECGMI